MQTNTAERLLEALTVEAANISTYETQLGFSRTEVDECNQDKANLEVTLDNTDVARAGSKGTTAIKDAYYNGNPAETIEPYPSMALTVLPFPSAKAGALSRYNNRKGRAKLAAGYTREIGIAMGYEDAPSEPVSPDSLQGSLKSYKDLGDYEFEAAFAKQGMSGLLIQYRVKGTERWFDIKTALSSPVTVRVTPPGTDGAALEIEIRVRLLDGNTQVGSWSPIYPLTLTA